MITKMYIYMHDQTILEFVMERLDPTAQEALAYSPKLGVKMRHGIAGRVKILPYN